MKRSERNKVKTEEKLKPTDQTKNSSDPSPDQAPQTPKQHYAGTFVAKRQMEQHDPVESADNPAQASKEPAPLEVVMRWWKFIKDPQHSQAIIAILTLVIAGTGIGYDIVASKQLSVMNDTLKLERPWIGAVGRKKSGYQEIDPKTGVQTGKFIWTGVQWMYQNGGHTVATRTGSSIQANLGPPIPKTLDVPRDTLPKNDTCEKGRLSEFHGAFTVPPGVSNSFIAPFVDQEIRDSLDKIRRNEVGLWIVGCVDYSDDTLTPWFRTNVLEYYHPQDDTFAQWPIGNDAR
jgi:hypothetical protein